ncbi:uncharacterized protein FRV6_15368 [Fusarium oxysporum]|uniref:Zn(2)-C6 fungal-type domain-containing protein n=1 Tax=Fusarium oxysporum TaxID=5507 RepID=A0A2H3U2N7_FUSOX|nr:uncharacterized protein FRV6_15368 [Fusarium oxysporum]
MAGTLTTTTTPNPRSKRPRPRSGVRCRAAKACRRCNERRVKCDASERGTPCTRCLERQEPDCKLIQSRRGIYVRKSRQESAVADQSSSANDNNDVVVVASLTHDSEASAPHPAPVPAPAPSVVTVEQLQQHDSPREQMHESDNHIPDLIHPQGNTPENHSRPNSQQNRGPTEHDNTSSSTYDAQSRDLHSDNAPPDANISWAAMFDRVLRDRRQRSDIDKCPMNYLGESFPIAIVLDSLIKENQDHSLPREQNSSSSASAPAADIIQPSHPPGMRPEELAYLESLGAFKLPAKDLLDAMVGIFFERIFPIYPIVDRHTFLQLHESHRVPWILLHALCSVSATFCPVHMLYRAGFDSRQHARWTFYSKAKALFNTGYETNKIVLLQVCIFLSFWGGGPNDTWNFYSWIGMGVTIAETIGCHRSTMMKSIRPQDRSLLKRLWWVLVVRDASSAALIGRPFKVNLDHCDTEFLSAADFEHDFGPVDQSASDLTRCSILYQIQATKLTLILRGIITARFQPQMQLSLDSDSLRQMLSEWRDQLPPDLAWPGNVTEHVNIFAATLSIMYHHHLILTYLRNGLVQTRQDGALDPIAELNRAEQTMNQSAQHIALVACSVVTRSDLLLAPHEIFHGVFVAAVVFTIQTKSPNPIIAQLGVPGLTNCRMVFQASRETWDPSPWFTQLFDKGLFAPNPPISQQTNNPADSLDASLSDIDNLGCDNTSFNAMATSGFDDPWQNYASLGNIFDGDPMFASFMAMNPDVNGRSGISWFDH